MPARQQLYAERRYALPADLLIQWLADATGRTWSEIVQRLA
jgi:hypothetical protein